MVTLNTCYTLQFYTGLEADTKPLGVPNGSMFLVMDTGKLYRFDAENQTWIDQANPTPSGGETIMFVTFTEDDGYTADKTFAEVAAAVEDGQMVIGVLPTIGGVSLLPLYTLTTVEAGAMADTASFFSPPLYLPQDAGIGGKSIIWDSTNDSITVDDHLYPAG